MKIDLIISKAISLGSKEKDHCNDKIYSVKQSILHNIRTNKTWQYGSDLKIKNKLKEAWIHWKTFK